MRRALAEAGANTRNAIGRLIVIITREMSRRRELKSGINMQQTTGKQYRKISELKNWDKNPRAIKEDDFERLKKQISELRQFKPLIITEDGTVLGGNMRLRAYRDSGIDEVWVSVVDAKTDAKKLEYALSDNDRAGYYQEEELAELVQNVIDSGEFLDTEMYKVDLGEQKSLTDLMDDLGPDGKDEKEYKSEFQVIVECQNEDEQKEVFNKLETMGLKCKVLSI